MSYAAVGAMSLQLLSGYWQSENMKDAAEIYIEDMIEAGEELPSPSDKIEIIDEPAVAVSL